MSTDHSGSKPEVPSLSKKEVWEFARTLAVGDEVLAKIKGRADIRVWSGVVRTMPTRKTGPNSYFGVLWSHNAVDELAFPEDGANGTTLRCYVALERNAAVIDAEDDGTPLRQLTDTAAREKSTSFTHKRDEQADDEEDDVDEEEEEEEYIPLNPRNEAVYMDPAMWAKVFQNDPERNADRIIDALHHRFGSVGAMTPEKHILDDILRALEHLVRMASRAIPLCREDEFVSSCKLLLGRLYLQAQKKAGMRASNLQALHEELTNLHPAKWVTAATKRASAKIRVGLVTGEGAQLQPKKPHNYNNNNKASARQK
jgi:hypothetical protein